MYSFIYRTLIIVLMTMMPAGSRLLAQSVGTSLMDSVEIGIITCSPHDEVYSHYGHTALRCHDLRTGEDVVFNYGIFNYAKPHFVLRFILGHTDYELGVAPTKAFCRYYARWGSEVTEHVLALTPEEKINLIAALRDNFQPQNRVYRYNFFYDNCATRPRDMVERNIMGKVEYEPRPGYEPSFRQMIRQMTEQYPWATFGNDILLGLTADLKTTQREQHFLPANLRSDLERAMVDRGGKRQPLVSQTRQLVPPGEQVSEPGFPLRPLVCSLLLLALSAVVFIYEQAKHTTARWFDVVLMTMTGLAGTVLFVMLFSEHPTTSTNLQVLLLNPLPFLFVWKVARGKKTQWFNIQLALTILFFIGGLWQSYAEGMYVLALCLLLRDLRHYHDK